MHPGLLFTLTLLCACLAAACGDDKPSANTDSQNVDAGPELAGDLPAPTPDIPGDVSGDTPEDLEDLPSDLIDDAQGLPDQAEDAAPDLTRDTTPDLPAPTALTVSAYTPLPDDMPPIPLEDGILSVADAQGQWVGTWRTDANGQATIDPVPPGGSVSLIRFLARTNSVETIYGVQAQDTLFFGAHRDSSRNGGAMQYTLAAPPVPAGDTLLVTPCVNAQNSAQPRPSTMGQLPLDISCVGQDRQVDAVALAFAQDRVSSDLVAVGLREDILVMGEEPNLAAEIQMDTWLEDPGLLRVTYEDNSEGLGLGRVLLSGKRGDVEFAAITVSSTDSPTTNTLQGTFDARVFDGVEVWLNRVDVDRGTGGAALRIARYGLPALPGADEEITALYTSEALPPAWTTGSVEQEGRGALLTGLAEAPLCNGLPADAVLGLIYTISGAQEQVVSWQFYSPFAARIEPPHLDPAFDVWPASVDHAVANVRLLTASDKDYDQLRQAESLPGGLWQIDTVAPGAFLCESSFETGDGD